LSQIKETLSLLFVLLYVSYCSVVIQPQVFYQCSNLSIKTVPIYGSFSKYSRFAFYILHICACKSQVLKAERWNVLAGQMWLTCQFLEQEGGLRVLQIMSSEIWVAWFYNRKLKCHWKRDSNECWLEDKCPPLFLGTFLKIYLGILMIIILILL
jgi:hypothetical protein